MTCLNNNIYKINLSDTFEFELDQIYYYLFYQLKEPITARRLHQKIIDSLHTLHYFPKKFSKISNLSSTQNIRQFVVDNYIIVYTVNAQLNEVFILHIFHSTQNYFNLL